MKIKKCPFCGEKDSVEVYDYNEFYSSIFKKDILPENSHVASGFVVNCNVIEGGCGAIGGYGLTKKDAIKKWNKRAHIAKKALI